MYPPLRPFMYRTGCAAADCIAAGGDSTTDVDDDCDTISDCGDGSDTGLDCDAIGKTDNSDNKLYDIVRCSDESSSHPSHEILHSLLRPTVIFSASITYKCAIYVITYVSFKTSVSFQKIYTKCLHKINKYQEIKNITLNNSHGLTREMQSRTEASASKFACVNDYPVIKKINV